jgi:hypothetical protein
MNTRTRSQPVELTNGTQTLTTIDGRTIRVAVERARVPACLVGALHGLSAVLVASLMLLLVMAAAAVAVWVVVS